MVERLLIGYHAGFNQQGIWLSKPGIDVRIAGPASSFILRPDLKAEQIVISGFAYVPSGSAFLPICAYPANLAVQPYVQLNANINPNQEYPHSLSLAGGSGSSANEIAITLQITNDVMYATQNSNNDLWVSFIVYNRSIS